MIEKMYKACVVSKLHDKRQMISDLRDLGLMHIRFEKSASVSTPELDQLGLRLASLQGVLSALEERADKKKPAAPERLDDQRFETRNEEITSAVDRIKALSEEIGKQRMKLAELSVWGDYSSRDYQFLSSMGVKLHFYTLGSRKSLASIPDDVDYILLDSVRGQCAVATVGAELPDSLGASEFIVDSSCPSELRGQIEQGEQTLQRLEALLRSSCSLIPAYKRQIAAVSEKLRFEMASDEAEEGDRLCWITGFVPESGVDAFKKDASSHGYAYLVDDVVPEDNPPTKLVYNKVTRLMKPLFDMLGTVPGYYEYDISMWFLMFFALFFAMIIGDAAYGALFLIGAAWLHVKTGKASNAVMLIYVLGGATVIWGAVTGTWFGSQRIIEGSKFLQLFVIKQISNYPQIFGLGEKTAQDTVMQFCFIVGTLQLSLACVMNILKKAGAKDISFVADIGWLVMIDALYFLVLMLVLNRPVGLKPIFISVLAGFVLVVAFGSQGPGISFGKGLAAGAGGIFTTFLNTISAFGNIMSYIRLFAVGMASLAIAQSFNDMASPMLSGMALPAGVLILVIGHGLNLVMGLLSVIVHGVRLNLLEFSGQLGMAWTGVEYSPFRKTMESK